MTVSELSEPESPDAEEVYLVKYGSTVPRVGKAFSYTFWRTQMRDDIFWSVQGNDFDGDGGVWIATEYFGPPQAASRFVQEVTVTHPVETNIHMVYTSTLEEGKNCIVISKKIVHHFKNFDNSFNFQFRIVRLRRRAHHRVKK